MPQASIHKFMASSKSQKPRSAKLKVVAEDLDQLYLALGRAVIVLKLAQGAVKKDKVTLRVCALQVRDQIRGLQKRQRQFFADLQKAGIVKKGI
jgi:hypothetical protein